MGPQDQAQDAKMEFMMQWALMGAALLLRCEELGVDWRNRDARQLSALCDLEEMSK